MLWIATFIALHTTWC